MWDLKNMHIRAAYLGEFPVTGRVESSRVCYAGSVSHTVALDLPITVYGAVRDRVIIEDKNVLQVASGNFFD